MRGKFTNATTGVASTAGKFAACFALGARILKEFYPEFAAEIGEKADAAYQEGVKRPGTCQTASVKSPYIYEEDNWTDDMELGAMELYNATGKPEYLSQALEYGRREPVTPWMGADSARHYQWYPFMNMGHYHLATVNNPRISKEFIRNMRTGIERTYEKAVESPFLHGFHGKRIKKICVFRIIPCLKKQIVHFLPLISYSLVFSEISSSLSPT